MNEELRSLKDMITGFLSARLPTPEMIRDQIDKLRQIYHSVTDEEAETLAQEFEAVHGVTMSIGATLEDRGFEKWLEGAKPDIEFYFWDRYKRLLGINGFSAQVLATLDSVTDKTLGLLGNPKKEGSWDRRGMVVGHVQSGKTSNYTGLICKAADAGYEVIIVIAGIHNNLRKQTQMRIDEGFIGFDSSMVLNNGLGSNSIVGVGRFDSQHRPNAFTNTLKDFNKATAESVGIPLENLRQPAVFVIKKNTSTLKNLLEWLREHNAKRGSKTISAPMLLIDDEADNASINIRRGLCEVSRINGQIRQLLKIFERSCYVGYTATPFANIFVDPDSADEMFGADLFPRDFIVSLDPPENYFGPSRVFSIGTEDDGPSSVIRHIEDNDDVLPIKHQINHSIVALPPSLEKAVRTFILARAIRLARGHEGKHNSMLVNASRFTGIQSKLRNQIHILVYDIKASIRVNGAKPIADALQDPEILALHGVFTEEYKANCEITWESLQLQLWNSISPISVIEVNSKSSGSLAYSDNEDFGLNVIAVGGFSLSRGLTLEGLIVSYFLRNSMMYDTLMQMGRWFGYRPRYDDLCRIWMSAEAEGWYAHIAESIEELREELRQMEAANATPKQFGLKVRSHPDTLIVTARNKMGSSERLVVSVGLANHFIETAILKRDPYSLMANRNAAAALAEKLLSIGSAQPVLGGRLISDVDASLVLDFLNAFSNHAGSFLTETDPVRKYIEDRLHSELKKWDIYFPGLQNRTNQSLVDNSFGFELVCQRRKAGKRSDNGTLFIADNQRVSSRGIERIGLSKIQIEQAEEAFRNTTISKKQTSNPNYPDRIFRAVRERPLLVVHLIAIGTEDDDLSSEIPVVAWSISFPKTQLEENKVEYVVNTTWFRERYREEEDEDEAGGDDE